MSSTPVTHQSFTFLRQETIQSLQLDAQLFQHNETGALHIHLDTGQDENVFLVAFRTMPMDSTGVAHILEHTSLCGSEKFPVRDPFFMMIRRSLNTFMNAFTSSDWTAYPFASQNYKDYHNLLEVYLDATFFARLDALDFAQEGHRVELESQTDGSEKLTFKGVVFNEMKGAMSSPVSQLWQNVSKHLFPTTTYHYNSGGEPLDIPDLSHEQLLEFYRSHYHPSNAIFMTSGNIPAQELQERFQALALHRFSRQSMDHLHINDEKRYFSPVRVQEGYAVDADDELSKSHHVMAWLLGQSTDLYQQLQANLLSRVLLDNSASPLRKVLETAGVGSAPSPLCGLEDSNREMTFVCGVEGADREQSEAFEEVVINCLQNIADEGVEQELVTSALHQLELSQREIGGDGYPFGMQLILTAMPAAIHHGDPLAALNLDPVIEHLREDIKNTNYIPQLIRDLLLNNPHRLTYTMHPDKQLAEHRHSAEQARLDALQEAMDEETKQQVRDLSQALHERQMQEDDASLLPEVTRQDIPVDTQIPLPANTPYNQQSYYQAGTNGLVYHQLSMPWPKLPQSDLPYFGLLAQLYTEMGVGSADYLQVQSRQAAVCGSISASLSKRGAADDADNIKTYFTLSTKGLLDKQDAIQQLLKDTLYHCRFDEPQRIRELIAQLRARRQQSVVNGGHSLAMTCASQNMSAAANMGYAMSGLEAINWLQNLDDGLGDESQLEALSEKLVSLQQKLIEGPIEILTVAEAHHQEYLEQAMHDTFGDHVGVFDSHFQWRYKTRPVKQLWTTNTQVNFCARAYPTVTSSHADAPALIVLGEIMRNGYLHRAVREQGGAYGGGASQDNNSACFRFYSYRDPRSAQTFADYDGAITWASQGNVNEQHLEEAVLGVIGSLDKPGSPAGEAISAHQNNLHDRTPDVRRGFRQRILNVTLDDVARVATSYFKDQSYCDAVIGPKELASDDYFKDFEVRHV
ncbi:MAG: peptidase M16 [Gammaproteobacteria bacterium]|nr:peptidase M16 [Gammaproteobacteria bacterium]